MQRIAALYANEAEINGQTAQQHLALREARSKPLLEDLHAWMVAQRRRLSAKSTLGKAMQYALNRWEALARHLEDGRRSIDSNLAERQRRSIDLTRKSILFLGSDAGRDPAATICTVPETAKLNGLDPGGLHHRRARPSRPRPHHRPPGRAPALALHARPSPAGTD